MEEGPEDNSLSRPDYTEEFARALFEGELHAKYEFRRLLGKGGMGRVFLARHRKLDELVAIKVLNQELSELDFPWRFRREARAAIRVRSPHVARVMDVGELASGAPYIVMEYLDGEDLSQWVARRGPLPPTRAAHFLLQALDALAEAHASGIIHRDIKPANLFVTRDREGRDFVKVLDFGLAKSMALTDSTTSAITEPGTLVGSPCYMPPEQLLDASNADARSDVWALGATLFELIAGEPPFRAPSMPQLYTAIVHGRIRRARDLVPECPEAIDAVIARCLTRLPASRYANAQELRVALSSAIGEEAPRAPETETLESSPPPAIAPLPDAPTTITPVASSWSPDERLVGLVRPRLLSRRRVAALAAVVLALSFGVVRIRHLSNAVAERATPLPARSATPSPSVPQVVPSSVQLLVPPPASSAPQTEPVSTKRRKSKEPEQPKAAASTSPPSIYDEYP